MANMMRADAIEEREDETYVPPPEEVEVDPIDLIIPHVFLPPGILHSAPEHLSKLETSMLEMAEKSISELSSHFRQLKPLVKMFKLWNSLQSAAKSPNSFIQKFTSEMKNLKSGDSVVCYMRNQNAAVLFTKVNSQHTVAQTWKCSFPSNVIMSNVNPLFVTFPHSTDTLVNKDVLYSKTFAKHLHELTTSTISFNPNPEPGNNMTPTTDVDPFLVTDWMIGLLVPVTSADSSQFKRVTKKIRDEVSSQPSSALQQISFRRSTLWTSIKVATQLKLSQMFPAEEATTIYKVIMLYMITTFCNEYNSNDSVIWSVMLTKLGRRTEKLRRIQIQQNSIADSLHQLTLEYVDATMSNINTRMDDMWNLECGSIIKILPVAQRMVEYSFNLVHTIPKLDNYMGTRMPSTSTAKTPEELLGAPPSDLRVSHDLRRCTTIDSLLATAPNGQKNDHKICIWIHDAECVIKKLTVRDVTSSKVYQLLNQYQSIAVTFYMGQGFSSFSVQDPAGMSQVVLCTLKLVQLLDQIASTKYPLLLLYSSGITQSAFDKLLLPFRDDMALLEQLLAYFAKRDTESSFPSLISSSEVTEYDFSVRYASENQPMINLRDEILADTKAEIKEKYDEIKSVLNTCRTLQNDIKNLKCECKYVSKWCNQRQSYYKRKVSTCKKCELESQLRSKRFSVKICEHALPPDSDKQWAVVFELMIPDDLANYRDALAFLNFKLLDAVMANPPIKLGWKSYNRTAEYDNEQLCKFYNLGSNTVSVEMKKGAKKDVMSTPKENYIVNNGMDCVYYHSCVGINESFKCKITNTSSPDREMYMPLQYALEGRNINQNQVIADGYNCHKDMSLSEFSSFGFLRDGERIQLRNLYAYIANSTLALEKEPVVQLIMQTLWEVGALEDDRDSRNRICHFDFDNNGFTHGLLLILGTIVAKNETNYGNALMLLSVIVITTRIAEMNVEVMPAALGLLRKCRSVLDTWVTRINESIDGQMNEAGKADPSLFLKLLHVSICSAFTFNISATIDQKLGTPDLLHWLHTITRLHQLVDQDKCLKHKGVSPFVKSLVNTSFNIALKMEAKILPELPALLKTFALSQWSKADCGGGAWSKLQGTQSTFFAIYEERSNVIRRHLLTFDYVQGIFLVDGFPQGVLPCQIRNDALYKSYFEDAKLKVQRDGNGFVTVTPFHSNRYEFVTLEDTVKIKEVHNTFSFELLDPELLEDKVGKACVDKYTHWLHSDHKRVFFRSKREKNEDCKETVDYTLVRSPDGKGWKFEDSNNKYLLARSNGFLSICKALSTIEYNRAINVMKDKTTNIITAHLPRYGLNFILEAGILHSVEYPEFQISQEQYLGTLIGLQRCLLLHNTLATQKQKLIVPHGNIVLKRQGSNHQETDIDIDNLHNPPYFTYDVDPVLCRMKAQQSKEAWLYLAALHGATSSPLKDPFTGLTGTEMAVWILQSAMVWSSVPYDDNCLRILKTIGDFSPKRSYEGQRLNAVNRREDTSVTIWPQGLNEMAAYDGYALIVKKLINDSNTLAMLNGGKTSDLEPENVSEKLAVRAYLRNCFYNQCAKIKPLYFPSGYQNAQVVGMLELRYSRETFDIKNLEKMSQSLLEADSRNDALVSLKEFLITENSLGYGQQIKSLKTCTLAELLAFDFRANWLGLYAHAISAASRSKIVEERLAWNILFAVMSYKKVDVSQLWNLFLILKYAHVAKFPPAPSGHFPTPSDNEYSDDRVESRLLNVSTKHPGFLEWTESNCVEQWRDYADASRKSNSFKNLRLLEKSCKNAYDQSKAKFESDCVEYIHGTVGVLQLHDHCLDGVVPVEKIGLIQPSQFFNNVEQVVDAINTELQLVCQNKKLLGFVENLAEMLNQAQNSAVRRSGQRKVAKKHDYKRMTRIELEIRTEPATPFEVNAEELFEPTDAHDVHHVSVWSPIVYTRGKMEFTDLSTRCENLSFYIKNVLTDGVEKRILAASGISPRLAPVVLLQHLHKCDEPPTFIKTVGALAVLWTQLQREHRIEVLGEGDAASVEHELAREKITKGYENWSPEEFPEWIVLQLELDMMIRPIQVKVAKQMMTMPEGKNGVMQLNMGEGKTSVIVPMLCATLAGGQFLVRVTVLKSIFTTNHKILSFTIGGLLNQRVYGFPCRRDMEVNERVLETINNSLTTCLECRGIILTLPEYRLSFRLKIYDEINKGNGDLGLQMMETETWLRTHVRDLLDESDELLSVKYQLVYTVGTQIPIDGNDLRWKTCQRLLEHVRTLAPQLAASFGTSVVEFISNGANPEHFNHIRFLSEGAKLYFYSQLGDMVLEDVMLSTADRATVKTFITQENPSIAIHKRVKEITQDTKDLLNKVLLLAGFIGGGILQLALTKRWRVEYGVDPKGHRRMAVPFRAKDVAAEKTEFGHPDLAIVVTLLSYYYSGLSDHEMSQSFDCLKTKNSPEMIYGSWVRKLGGDVPPFLSSYQGINLKDSFQRTHLFNTFRKHKTVIDFFLSEKVFPKESKQFPGKMSMSAWDLCHEKNNLPVSGFSGTNDSSVLLPLGIDQQDLEQLAHTNKQLEQTLLKPENVGHRALEMGVTCEHILEQIVQDGFRVLIDAGALMLELDNEQVASRWLEIDRALEATIYFDKNNEILVKTRETNEVGVRMKDMRLEFSPFRNRLGACGVFLDDQHTRGTDLNFPTGSRACVTVGTRMRREKLMQASMRMRKLGNGHSVAFYLSHEVFDKVTTNARRGLHTADIIAWVRANTRDFNDDGLVHWAIAGKNYAQKLAAEETFERGQKSVQEAAIMGAQVVNQEVTLLENLYGVYTKSELLVHIIPQLFDAMKQKLVMDNKDVPLPPDVELMLNKVCSSVVSRCQTLVPHKTHVCTDLEDEQEKELEKEVEVEEERQVRRPPKAEHAVPSLHPNVWKVLRDGKLSGDGIVPISNVFANVSFSRQVQSGWAKNVYVTEDFAKVIKTSSFVSTDLHLRPVEYVAVRVDPKSKAVQILVLSPFEVNELMPLMRGNCPVFTLHMFSMRRTECQDTLINNAALQVPSRGIVVDETDSALACLHVAAGNLYFDTCPEAKAYAAFLGLATQPWSDAEQEAFEDGWITKTGFKLPHNVIDQRRRSSRVRNSHRASDEDSADFSGFQCDPGSFVKHILACRHSEKVNEVAHVIQLLDHLTLSFSY